MLVSIWFYDGERRTLKNISEIYSGKSKKLANNHIMLFASKEDGVIKTYYSNQIKKVTIKPKKETK